MKNLEPIFVTDASICGELTLCLRFNDNTRQRVDFSDFILSSANPHIRKYADPKLFATFEITDGDLQWNDYDLCFPVIDLYENRISAPSSTRSAA